MKSLQLSIALSDEALAAALARAIAKEYPYVHAAVGEREDADFTIRDDFLGTPAPVREIMDRVLAIVGKELITEDLPDSCPFTAFTSGGGGRGVSTCAGYYASVLSLQKKNVLLLSLDPYLEPTDPQAGMALLKAVSSGARIPVKAACVEGNDGYYLPARSGYGNLLHELDTEEASAFFHGIEDSGEWEAVVLDVPRAYGGWKDVMNMCETQIVVVSEDGHAARRDEAAFLELQELAERSGRTDAARLVRFRPARDAALQAGHTDLYGPLGCEVRELAQQLADN